MLFCRGFLLVPTPKPTAQKPCRGYASVLIVRSSLIIQRSFRSLCLRASVAHDLKTGTAAAPPAGRSEEHTSELQSRLHLVCRLLPGKKKTIHGHRRRVAADLKRAPAIDGAHAAAQPAPHHPTHQPAANIRPDLHQPGPSPQPQLVVA